MFLSHCSNLLEFQIETNLFSMTIYSHILSWFFQLCVATVWPDLAKFHPVGNTVEVFGYFMGGLFCIWQILAPTLWIFHAFWQIALLQMATFWLNSLAIRSHWRHTTPTIFIDICKMLILIGRNSAATNTAKRI